MQKSRATGFALATVTALIIAGCATLGFEGPPPPPTSVQTLEYYPFLVKGYQDSYPHRRILVLAPVDARDFRDAGTPDHEPSGGNPAVGLTTAEDGTIVQRLYSTPLAPIVQKAIARSAEEAGMTSNIAPESDYKAGTKLPDDYVLTSKITRCWVKKHRGNTGRYGPIWTSAADFSLEIAIYKPPFGTPFWEGTSNAEYTDPPVGSFGLGPEDEAGIYDEPGQVLSVALTRSVAGIWQHNDLRSLLLEDQLHPR